MRFTLVLRNTNLQIVFRFFRISIALDEGKFMIFVPYDNIYKIHYFTNGVVDFNYRCLFSHGVLFYGDVSKFGRLYR